MISFILSLSTDILFWIGRQTYNLSYYLVFGHQKTPEEIIRSELKDIKLNEERLLIELYNMRKDIEKMRNDNIINENQYSKHYGRLSSSIRACNDKMNNERICRLQNNEILYNNFILHNDNDDNYNNKNINTNDKFLNMANNIQIEYLKEPKDKVSKNINFDKNAEIVNYL
jgi:hypothetical protein